MRLRDQQLRSVLSEQRVATVRNADVLRVLAAVADGASSDVQQVLERLRDPGLTRAQQLELVKSGLDPDELADVAELLDAGELVFTAADRNFLEALLGRAPLDAGQAVQVTVADGGVLEGTLGPGETVEALNLTTATTTGARLHDTVVVGRTDAWGRFQGTLPDAQQGDVLRLQTRNAQGKVTAWLNVRVQQAQAADLRAAYVDLGRLTARAHGDGTITLTHKSRLPLCEPGATLRFRNPRTGEQSDVTVDENGRIPPLRLGGLAGDTISVAVSDGAGNTDFSFIAGSLTVASGNAGALADPAPLARDSHARVERFQGPLFQDAITVDDVKQGQIGNCYVPAACAAVAHAEPDAIRDLIRDNGDGSYTVTLHPVGQGATEIVVDADLYASGGRARYGTGQLWFSLVEKAFAVFRGSYEVVGQGGSVGQMMSELVGRPNTEHWLRDANADQVFTAIQKGSAEKRAMAAGTYGTQESARYTNTGVYANHAYSVLDALEENGQRYVVLRNPWGSGEPAGDGNQDGIFRLPLEKFLGLYQVLNVC
ncbi:MAG: C2 family cysteine protease [Myxococcota bacterium]